MLQSDLKVYEEGLQPESCSEITVLKNALIEAFSAMKCKDLNKIEETIKQESEVDYSEQPATLQLIKSW